MVTVESLSYPQVTEAVLLKDDNVFLKDMNQLREYNMNHISFLHQQMRGKRAELEQWMTVQGIRHQQQMHQWMTVQGIRHQQQMIGMRAEMQQQMRAEMQQQIIGMRAELQQQMRAYSAELRQEIEQLNEDGFTALSHFRGMRKIASNQVTGIYLYLIGSYLSHTSKM